MTRKRPAKRKFDWSEWSAKQGTLFVILCAFGAFFRYDVWVPVRTNMEKQSQTLDKQTEILASISDTQKQMRDETRVGIWRATEPPSPSELPKGIEPARE